ncbi:hypothetical protein SAMN04487906_0735 [Zhouia amylolytica]|uniref:Outer membrane lipoprotein-sorting protein n=1 Tax=Zhouia amylolytica TaxID=376730 RepID=A0A1I6QMI1_9FLAO|nr:hypothetical protein [Zhouia amylolytica]SFS53655.1 hypothetical protein SAMN04487906_0735 [Zhouia amylolytica]
MKNIIFGIIFLGIQLLGAQEPDEDLMRVRERLDSLSSFKATIELDVDISFIKMPKKYADISYERGERIQFESDDFVMLPKRGLDFSFSNLFKYSFITVDRGFEVIEGKKYKAINIIPTDKKADFSIAMLLLDTENDRIVGSEISTKKEGTYQLSLQYASNKMPLPEKVEVAFEVERMKIPLNYMGKDIDVDKKSMREEEVKKGKIYLNIENYQIRYVE